MNIEYKNKKRCNKMIWDIYEGYTSPRLLFAQFSRLALLLFLIKFRILSPIIRYLLTRWYMLLLFFCIFLVDIWLSLAISYINK